MANNAAFEILYREYYVRVFGLCRRLLNSPQQAEDATQEVFMRAYKNFNKYKSDQPFWQWIAAIANNYCIDLLRKRVRTESLFGDEADELDHLESDNPGTLDNVLSMENVALVNSAIAGLPEKYRVPLILAYFNQSPYDEIATQLDISRNHVGVLLLRAKQQLRASLEQQQGPAPEQGPDTL